MRTSGRGKPGDAPFLGCGPLVVNSFRGFCGAAYRGRATDNLAAALCRAAPLPIHLSKLYGQHDAYSIAAWLARAGRGGSLGALFKPELSPSERAVAQVEGWLLGVPGLIRDGQGDHVGTASDPCNADVFRLH